MCIHLLSCIWHFIAINESTDNNWLAFYKITSKNKFEQYLTSFYYITTTICTVGYGDITPQTYTEKIFSILLMIIGILSYSFAVGTLTILLNTIDFKNARLQERLAMLDQIKADYNLNYEFYIVLRKALEYDNTKSVDDKANFLKLLPQNLKLELSYIMFKNLKNTVKIFKAKPRRFLASIGPFLKPQKISKNEYICLESDLIDCMFFLVKGEAAIVLTNFEDYAYVKIEEGDHFGEYDLMGYKNDKFGFRMFTVKAKSDCEYYSLNLKDMANVCKGNDEILDEILEMGYYRNRQISAKRDEVIGELKAINYDLYNTGINFHKSPSKFNNAHKIDGAWSSIWLNISSISKEDAIKEGDDVISECSEAIKFAKQLIVQNNITDFINIRRRNNEVSFAKVDKTKIEDNAIYQRVLECRSQVARIKGLVEKTLQSISLAASKSDVSKSINANNEDHSDVVFMESDQTYSK